MRRVCCWALAGLLFLAGAAAVRAADKKDGKADAATPQEIAALEQAGEAVGTIGKVDATAKTLTLHMEWQKLEPSGNSNASMSRELQNLMRQQEQLQRTHNPVQRAQEMQRLMQQISKYQSHPHVKAVTEKADFELQATSDTKVRLRELPPRTGTDGKPLPYSFKEREDARSPDPALVGYHADFGGLSTGMTVKVTFGQAKQGETKIPVRMIIIEPQPAAPAADPSKDKK